MVDVDEFGFKTAELHRVSRLDRVQLSLLCQLVLVQLVFEDAERQPVPYIGGFIVRRTYGIAPM